MAITSNIVDVVGESRGESAVTALIVTVVLGRILTAAIQPLSAARLGHRPPLQTSTGDILPVSPAGDSTALHCSPV